MWSAGENDEIRIKYSRAMEAVGVEARLEGFTAEGKRPRARLVVRLSGDPAEYSIRLHRDNAVVLEFGTTSREEAERRAALLRSVGVKAGVQKKYDKIRNRDEWRITVTTNALAAESVYEAVRKPWWSSFSGAERPAPSKRIRTDASPGSSKGESRSGET